MTEPNSRGALAAEAAARHSYGKLVAFLSARTRDVTAAEDALAEAFAAALASWPRDGVPRQPEAWLMKTAQNRWIDSLRRQRSGEAVMKELEMLMAERGARETTALPDDRLRLMFACAHPAIDPAARAPLMLQTILGFDAAAIAEAFLASPAAMGQRLVRAKRRIREAGIPFAVPEQEELAERLDAVLDAIYATFSKGWADPAAQERQQQALAGEGIWLGRLIASLLPAEAEALGLLALMLFAEARRAARRNAAGDYIALTEQDPAAWDAGLIAEAEALLHQAKALGTIGRFQIEAAIQSAHAARRQSGRIDWPAIVTLYDALAALCDSPVVAVNRAAAVAEAEGPEAGLALLERAAADRRLTDYQPYWAARAALLAACGAVPAADAAYERAIDLESDEAVRRYLQQRRSALCH